MIRAENIKEIIDVIEKEKVWQADLTANLSPSPFPLNHHPQRDNKDTA